MTAAEEAPPRRQNLQWLRRKIVLYAVLYTLAALVVVALLIIIPVFNRLRRSEETNLQHAASIRTVAIEEYLEGLTRSARQVSSQLPLRYALEFFYRGEMGRQALVNFTHPKLTEALRQSRSMVGITRLSRQREILVQAGVPIPQPLWPPLPRNGEPVIADPQVIGSMLYLIVALPVRGERDEPLGTDLFLFTTTHLQRIVWNPATLRPEADSFLGRALDDRTEIFFPGRLGEREIYKAAAEYSLYRIALERAGAGESGVLRLPRPQRGEPDIVAYAPVGETGWGLLVTMATPGLYAGVNRLLVSLLGAVLLLALAGGLGILFLLRPLTGRALDHSVELERLNRNLEQEVAERRRVEESLRRSEREWSQTFEAMTDAVAIIDTEGRVVRMNRANASFLAGLSTDILGSQRCKVHFGLEKSDQTCPFNRMLQSKQPEIGELFEPRSERYYHIAVYPLLDAAGELWGGVHIAHDITEQKKMEYLKDEMISSVSHEMRTPLTAMLGFIEYLLENPVDPQQQRDFLRTVHRETERLNDLISSFLDLQRLQAELESYDFETLPVPELLGEAAHLFTVASRKHRIILDVPAGVPPVRGDAKRLQQVLKNLLSNAIKYSPEGGTVTLGAEQEGGHVKMWVRDEGMGIPPQALGRIFDRFYRVDDSARRIPGGIGLGLALVREVLRAHGGRVWAESILGEGSTFYFTLPVAEGRES
jgi:PAS domain S-box-containing protein